MPVTNRNAYSKVYTATTHIYVFLAYAVFFATFVYGIGFVGNIVVPKSIDSGIRQPIARSLLIDLGLLVLLIIVHHQILCRSWPSRRLNGIIPASIERGSHILIASLALLLLFRQWRPIPQVVWAINIMEGRWLVWIAFGFGALTALFVVLGNVVNFQALRRDRLGKLPESFRSRQKERRRPQHLQSWTFAASTIALWATPLMTWGHLIFAVVITGFVFATVRRTSRQSFEENSKLAISVAESTARFSR